MEKVIKIAGLRFKLVDLGRHRAWGMEHRVCGKAGEKSGKGEKGKKKKMQNHLTSDLRPLTSQCSMV